MDFSLCVLQDNKLLFVSSFNDALDETAERNGSLSQHALHGLQNTSCSGPLQACFAV